MEGSGSGLTVVPMDRSALGAPASPRFWEQECRRRNFWGSLWTFFPFFFSVPSPGACGPGSVPTCLPTPKVSRLGSLAGLYRRDHIRGVLQDGGPSCSPF